MEGEASRCLLDGNLIIDQYLLVAGCWSLPQFVSPHLTPSGQQGLQLILLIIFSKRLDALPQKYVLHVLGLLSHGTDRGGTRDGVTPRARSVVSAARHPPLTWRSGHHPQSAGGLLVTR
jgi:hypothetical protein